MPTLSPRLQAVLDLAGPCGLLADVCSDHAQLALAAVDTGVAQRAVAVELRSAPLLQAGRFLSLSGLAGRVSLLRGSGLAALRRADVVVVAGVGGDLAAELLAEALRVGAARVVVQPNRHGREVRAWARSAGYHLTDERVIDEGGPLHLVQGFSRRDGPDPAYGSRAEEIDLLLGPLLLASTGAAEVRFLGDEQKRLRSLLAHRPEVAAALRVLEERSKGPPA